MRAELTQHLRIFGMEEMLLHASLLFYYGAELLSFLLITPLATLFLSRFVFCWASATSNGRTYDIFDDFMCGIREKKRLASYTHERIDRSRSESRSTTNTAKRSNLNRSAILCHCDDEKEKHLKDGTRQKE